MPTLALHLPEGSELVEKIKDRAKRFHDGRVSAFLRAAVERDLQGEAGDMLRMPSPVDPYVMEKLTRVLLGHIKAGRMSAVMEGRDQVAELTDLLEHRLIIRERERNQLVAEEQADYGPPHKPAHVVSRAARPR